MDVFVARQPVLDADLKIYGHELLYRSSAANLYTGTDHRLSSLEVIHNSLFSPDIASAAPGRKVFINFTRELLLSEAAHVLDPHNVIIEVLENTVIDREVLDACQKLRERGYVLAADDIALVDQMAPLLELVDVIKVDFRAACGDACKEIIATYGNGTPAWPRNWRHRLSLRRPVPWATGYFRVSSSRGQRFSRDSKSPVTR